MANEMNKKAILKQAIIDVSIKHQLMSKFTSRVAVEEIIRENPHGELITTKVPTNLPKGWTTEAFFPTATNDPLLVLIAVILLGLGVSIVVISVINKRKRFE
jgi:hypothetical protein